jgi:hypothetical protein
VELDETLRRYLTEVTQRVIAEAIHRDITDVEERSEQAPRISHELAGP